MIDSSNPSNQTSMINRSIPKKTLAKQLRWLNFLRWFFYFVLLTLGGGLSYSWYFLTQKLSPLVEKELTNYLNRPVELGKVEALSLSGVKFGRSTILPTDTDGDHASTEVVDVNFDFLKLLIQKELQLELTLIKPHIYVEQDDPYTWINTKLDDDIPQWNGITISTKSIHLDNTDLTLQARSKTDNVQPGVNVKLSQTQVFFAPQTINFNVEGKLIEGGHFDLDGVYKNPQQQLNLSINAQAIAVTEINNLIPLPLNLASGEINSNLQVRLNRTQVENITGYAELNQLTINSPKLPQSLSQTEGKLTFFRFSITIG